MKIRKRNAATHEVTDRDATAAELAEAGHGDMVDAAQLEVAAMRALTRKMLDAELAKPTSDIPEVEAWRAARRR